MAPFYITHKALVALCVWEYNFRNERYRPGSGSVYELTWLLPRIPWMLPPYVLR